MEKPDTWVDVSETIDLKVNALKKHASQLGDWDPEKMIREWAAEEGKEKEIGFAEAYKVMVLKNDEEKKEDGA